MSSILIRRLAREDAEAYRGLSLEGYRLHGDAFTATVAEREPLPIDWWRARTENQFVTSAWSDGRLVGVAGLAPETRPKTRHKATLVGMHVDVAFMRRGIGTRLVRAVLDHAAQEPPLRIVQLTVSETNVAARSLYERCGFVAFGVEPFGIADAGPQGPRYVAKVHMWIDLAARAVVRPAADAERADA